MDVKVSRKETRLQPKGSEEILVDHVFDFYPIESSIIENRIDDIEVLDGEAEELLDRALFASVKQRGGDATDPESGVQWAEAVLGEVSPFIAIQQVQEEVQAEGSGVRVEFETLVDAQGIERLFFRVRLS